MNISFRIQKDRGNGQGTSVVLVNLTWQGEQTYLSSGRFVNRLGARAHQLRPCLVAFTTAG